jgi:hypothetical protein
MKGQNRKLTVLHNPEPDSGNPEQVIFKQFATDNEDRLDSSENDPCLDVSKRKAKKKVKAKVKEEMKANENPCQAKRVFESEMSSNDEAL